VGLFLRNGLILRIELSKLLLFRIYQTTPMLTRNNFKKIPLAYVLSVFLYVFSPLLTAAATIDVTTDRDPIVLNEQFSLVFSVDTTPNADPDFSPLKKDFDILQQGKSSSVQIINGAVSQKITWTLQLFPKHAGVMKIPAIDFGSDQSQEKSINVVTQSQVQATGKPTGKAIEDIIVEAEVDAKTAYVQQQIIYTQRLYFSRDFFDNATLSTPQLKSGKIDLEKLGEGREYTETRQGRQYKVIERRYAIFPIQSGQLEIAPTFFEGRLIEQNNRQNNFGFFNRPTGQVVRRYSAPINIEVKPQIATYAGNHWLPASQLTLHSRWSSPPKEAKTGDPLTLTLSIIANGLRAEQLPQLNVEVPTGLKTYNDQPVLNNETNSNGLIGTRQEKIVVIATKAGSFEIPAITLTWWDTSQTKQQVATIPAMTLTATGVAATAPPIAPTTPTPAPITSPSVETVKNGGSISGDTINNTNNVANPSDSQTAPQTLLAPLTSDDFWFYFSLFLLLILVLVIYLLWQQLRENLPNKPSKMSNPSLSLESLLAHVNQACASHNHKALRFALCRWGSHVFQQPNINLHTLVEKLDERDIVLKAEIQQLMKVLYAAEKINWDSQGLCQAVRQYSPNKIARSQPSRIASLYPE